MDKDSNFSVPAATSIRPATSQDLHRYAHRVAHLNIPEPRKTEMLDAVWQIMRSFVDRAFGDDAVQLCRNPVDSRNGTREIGDHPVIELDPTPELESENSVSATFNEQGGRDSKERTTTYE